MNTSVKVIPKIQLRKMLIIWMICFLGLTSCTIPVTAQSLEIIPGAWQLEWYKPKLKGKRVALLMNHTATIGDVLLVDTLLQSGIDIVKLFVPEHGFRGTADAGAYIQDGIDSATQIPVISLYGKNKKPTKTQLQDVDIVVYDIQDVGVRFYTYISTLQYMMEACAAWNIPMLILDRPNPHGHYVDGPVLQPSFSSFVGMQPIPVVYGMTVGEYAQMLIGEKWFPQAEKLRLEIITMEGYTHHSLYQLPIPPSPNLSTMHAIYQYPSLCFFEGTVVSVGRGTPRPFEQWGHPSYKAYSTYYFTPQSRIGAAKPLYQDQKCYGLVLNDSSFVPSQLDLSHVLTAYHWYEEKDKFFNNFFDKLAGTDLLRKQIREGKDAAHIRNSWQPELDNFKKIRKKYLLYPDFEE
jgi:uncharacterized protein YbbC (DUF1343 family)